MRKVVFFLFIILLLKACYPIYHLYIVNNSNKPIYFLISKDYPNTDVPSHSSKIFHSLDMIKAHEVYYKISDKYRWEETFQGIFPKDTLIIFFFEDKGHTILERRMYSKHDLKESDWRIVYP